MFEIGTLDQFAEITMGQSPKGSTVGHEGKIPLLNGPSEFSDNNPIAVQYTNDPKRFARKGDLLFCVRGSTGKMNWADQDYAIGRGLAAIRPKDKISKYFLRGSIEFFLKDLISAATGSVFSSINKIQLHKMKCFIPDKKSVEIINKFLENFSKKIELNNQINHNLEEIAKNLFKSWFIHFDPVRAKQEKIFTTLPKDLVNMFPNSFETTDLGKTPKGFVLNKLGDHIKIIKGKSYKSSELQKSDTALVTLKSFERNGGYREDGLKEYNGTYKEEQVVKEGDLIVAFTDVTQSADVIGKPAIIIDDKKYSKLVISLDVGVLKILKKSPLSKSFIYFLMLSKRYASNSLGYTNGTNVLHLDKKAITDFIFCLPNNELLEKFNKISEEILKKISINKKGNKILINLKNTILPRLISGKIDFSNKEKYQMRDNF